MKKDTMKKGMSPEERARYADALAKGVSSVMMQKAPRLIEKIKAGAPSKNVQTGMQNEMEMMAQRTHLHDTSPSMMKQDKLPMAKGPLMKPTKGFIKVK